MVRASARRDGTAAGSGSASRSILRRPGRRPRRGRRGLAPRADGSIGGSGRQLARDVLDQHVDGVEVADLLDVGVGGELGQVGVGHPGLELVEPLGRQLAVLDHVGVGDDVLGEQLAARDLDPEVPLEPEHDVQEVDRLGARGRPGGWRRG